MVHSVKISSKEEKATYISDKCEIIKSTFSFLQVPKGLNYLFK